MFLIWTCLEVVLERSVIQIKKILVLVAKEKRFNQILFKVNIKNVLVKGYLSIGIVSKNFLKQYQ